MRLSKIKKALKSKKGGCVLRTLHTEAEARGNLYMWWLHIGANYYAGENAISPAPSTLAACMEMTEDEKDGIVLDSKSELADAPEISRLSEIPQRIDMEALINNRDVTMNAGGQTVHLMELEDGTWGMVREEDVEPCYRKGEMLRWTRVAPVEDEGEWIAAYSSGELVSVMRLLDVPDVVRKLLRDMATRL